MTITPDDDRPADPYEEILDGGIDVVDVPEEDEAPEPSDADGRPVPLSEDE